MIWTAVLSCPHQLHPHLACSCSKLVMLMDSLLLIITICSQCSSYLYVKCSQRHNEEGTGYSATVCLSGIISLQLIHPWRKIAQHALSCANHTHKRYHTGGVHILPVFAGVLTSLKCEWPFSLAKKETFDIESFWKFVFVICFCFVTGQNDFDLAGHGSWSVLVIFWLWPIYWHKLNSIRKERLTENQVKTKVGIIGKISSHIVRKALKAGFFIICMKNKVKSIVLVVRNTCAEISGQQFRFSEA